MEYLLIWLLLLLFSAIGAIITLMEREVNLDVVLDKVKEINNSNMDVDKKAVEITNLLNRNKFNVSPRDSYGVIRATNKKFSAGWFMFWSGFLLIIGSLIYISYFVGIKKTKHIKIDVGIKQTPKEREQSAIEKLEKLSNQFKSRMITEDDFNQQKEVILKQMKNG